MSTRIFVIAGMMTISAAGAKPEGAIDSTAAFARIKALAGEWQAETPHGKARLTYEVIAGGTSVVERDKFDQAPAMVTVYHMDGDRLLLEHYCMAGNQPRMEASSFHPENGELRFRFVDITNLAGKDAIHMRNATFHFVDADHLTSDWELYEGGKRKTTESFQYTRVR